MELVTRRRSSLFPSFIHPRCTAMSPADIPSLLLNSINSSDTYLRQEVEQALERDVRS